MHALKLRLSTNANTKRSLRCLPWFVIEEPRAQDPLDSLKSRSANKAKKSGSTKEICSKISVDAFAHSVICTRDTSVLLCSLQGKTSKIFGVTKFAAQSKNTVWNANARGSRNGVWDGVPRDADIKSAVLSCLNTAETLVTPPTRTGFQTPFPAQLSAGSGL